LRKRKDFPGHRIEGAHLGKRKEHMYRHRRVASSGSREVSMAPDQRSLAELLGGCGLIMVTAICYIGTTYLSRRRS
jgi:hypothetical protein